MSKEARAPLCPCESGKAYKTCCGLYHAGEVAPTAEALMRSRYTAYVFKLEDYLLRTWHPDTRPVALNLNADSAIKWIGLQVNHAQTQDSTATVDFMARYKINGKAERLHELSQFVCLDSQWFYLSGTGTDTGTQNNSDI